MNEYDLNNLIFIPKKCVPALPSEGARAHGGHPERASGFVFFLGVITMSYKHISVPETGEMIVVNADNSLSVPDNPIIPYIEGEGIGVDISPVMIAVVDAAVAKA